MFNKIVMLGNATRSPELKYLPTGGVVCTIGLATNRKFKKTDGSYGEEVCFIDVTLFGRSAEIANQYLRKGSKCLVEGRLKLDSWTDNNGQKRSRHSITAEALQLLDRKDAQPAPDHVTEAGVPVTIHPAQSSFEPTELLISDEENPFS